MSENITEKRLMAIAIGTAFGLFCTLLLNMHGFTKSSTNMFRLVGTVILFPGDTASRQPV